MSAVLNKSSQISPSALIMPGAYVGDGVTIAEEVVVGPNACVLGRESSIGESSSPATTIKAGARIGANATIVSGVIVGAQAVVKPGSVVNRSVPPLAIVEGNPAIITGYVSTVSSGTKNGQVVLPQGPDKKLSRVKDVTLHRFKAVPDLRGNLAVGEFEREIPFFPKRYFLVFDVPTAETRGEHAHVHCEQFLICVRGTCSVVADDGVNREEFTLDSPDKGLYLPPMTWGIQYRYTRDAMLLVFASDYYDANDYIRDYDDFLCRVNIGLQRVGQDS